MNTVLLLTACRRYHELAANLPETLALAETELGRRPEAVLVWARPEPSRLSFVRGLVASGLVSHVLGRPALPGEEGAPTTHFESLNIRAGLEFIAARYPPSTVVMAAADVRPRPGTLAMIREKIEGGDSAVIYHWENGCANAGVWHTNFFAVPSRGPSYWPPVSAPDSPDVLEAQWGRRLELARPPGIFRWHNSGQKRFSHAHDSEGLPAFPSAGVDVLSSLTLHCAGARPV